MEWFGYLDGELPDATTQHALKQLSDTIVDMFMHPTIPSSKQPRRKRVTIKLLALFIPGVGICYDERKAKHIITARISANRSKIARASENHVLEEMADLVNDLSKEDPIIF